LIMTHADDDGLVLPPRLAPAHAVILPIYRNDDERAEVLPYCEQLKADLAARQYDGEPVRVRIDDRDLRGGEKKWQWVKRGVPLRIEVGPRDVGNDGAFVARRDVGGKGKPTPRSEIVESIAQTLSEIQQTLFDRAAAAREAVTTSIDALGEFEEFFTPKNAERPEIHGGLAYCHFVDSDEMEKKLAALKVTVRCIPQDGPEEPGKCLFTGQPSTRRGVFAKAY
jgi:prolyl-tRNA synthetase